MTIGQRSLRKWVEFTKAERRRRYGTSVKAAVHHRR